MNLTCVFVFVDTMTWFKPAIQGKLPKPRKTHAMALVGSRLFLFGGHDGEDRFLLHPFSLPLKSGKWKSIKAGMV